LPELPEIEHLKRSLEPILVGAAVDRVILRRKDVAWVLGRRLKHPTRRELLQDTTIVGLQRHGKNLALVGESGAVLCVHLGMSGQFRFVPFGERLAPSNHVHCLWHLRSNDVAGRLFFRDPRRFGGLWAAASLEQLFQNRWNGLGPDALTISGSSLASRIGSTRRTIKAALLDQAVLAGVGNIYADEALFRAGIHPCAAASKLPRENVDRLADAIGEVLCEAIHAGGSTIRNYVDAAGREGDFVSQHQVYGRAGQPCLRCGKPLVSANVAQRTTVFCDACQRPFG
jgi:formamidopyrimidine-DNA glycosylase